MRKIPLMKLKKATLIRKLKNLMRKKRSIRYGGKKRRRYY